MGNERTTMNGEMDAIKAATFSDIAALAWLEGREQRIRWLHMSGNDNERSKYIAHRTNQGIAGTVIRTGRPFSIDASPAELSKARKDDPLMLAEKLLSVIAVPIVQHGEVRGVLLAGKRTENAYTGADIDFLAGAGGRLAEFISKGELTL